MGKVHDGISGEMQAFLERQPMFFVATAPRGADGHVNVSPKGLDGTFAVLGPHRVAYLDLTGSGIETIAHLRDNGRITLMFCAFDGPARIVRLFGRGAVVTTDDPGFAEHAAPFAPLPGTRAVITVELDRVSDSCGYGVPHMTLLEQRNRLLTWAEAKGDAGLVEYRADRNATSIDGLPGYGPSRRGWPEH
jgi:Pyridoxamine 5'-phosphate oxidase